jgi:ribosomal protein S18 acetylase RimI-like enzyme
MLTISETKEYKIIAELTEEVQNLHARLYPELFKPFSKVEMEKALANHFADNDCYCYLVKQDGVNIGCAVLFIREAKENAFRYPTKTLHIDQICVLSKFQRSGAGKLLLEQAEKLARKNSIKKIELDHWSANIIAAGWFRKNGYKVYRERLVKLVN